MEDKAGNFVKAIEVAERLMRLEIILEGIKEHLNDQKEQDEKLDKKIDKILANDSSKLQRITRNETSLKNIRTTLYVFVVPLLYSIVRSFM